MGHLHSSSRRFVGHEAHLRSQDQGASTTRFAPLFWNFSRTGHHSNGMSSSIRCMAEAKSEQYSGVTVCARAICRVDWAAWGTICMGVSFRWGILVLRE